ncbi:tyrosine--tRNA ligase [Candidatus Gracilibacteria bacterium]|nr:tyrosine--tRNA ligase [Candidatus Gracilibacteria bacterium]
MSKDLLERGITEVIVKDELEKKLAAGDKLRIYLGIDPTGSDLTIGHAVPLRKLKQFQDLGHQVILLFGTFTARIGDPTGKNEMRVPLTPEQIEENMKTYLEQAGKVLNIDKVEVVKNGDWLDKMSFADVLKLAGTFTVSQMLQRDMYQDRIKQNKEINLTEFMYPLMQGYDPIPIKADIQIGGTDQLFNLMAGRKIMEAYGVKPQHVITVQILEGLDGVEKMSKSLNNYIAIFDTAKEMYGKTMSIPDNMITRYFELATDVETSAISEIAQSIEKGDNPRDHKMHLAREIIALYHDKAAADQAEKEFIEIFANKGIPDEIEVREMPENKYNIVDLVAETELSTSKSEARRLVQGGGVRIDGEKVPDITSEIDISEEKLLQVGKRKFLKVVHAR